MAAVTREALEQFTTEDLLLMRWQLAWKQRARAKQIPPNDDSWNFYGVLSGRSFGKTLSAANWLGIEAARDPGSYNFVVSPTHDDVQGVCFNGPTGLHSQIPKGLIKDSWTNPPSIRLWNDAYIRGFAADSPERLRGPQCLVGETLVRMADGVSKPIASIMRGDSVLTRSGPRRVMQAWKSSNSAEIWRLSDGHGRAIHGTMKHKVFTVTMGWVPLWQISSADRLCVLASSTMESSSTSGQTVISSTRSESVPATKECAAGLTYTAASMSAKSVQFPASIMSIIWTTIRQITQSKILSYFLSTSIGCIMRPVESSLWPLSLLTREGCVVFGRKQNGGTSSAIGVAKISSHAHGQKPGFSAQRSARPNIGTTLFRRRHENVWNAISRTWRQNRFNSFAEENVENDTAARQAPDRFLITTKSASVSKLPMRAPVYDLEVDEAHEFFANGILVHNCHRAWGDEVASWRRGIEAWDNLIMGLRLGHHPQLFWTGTPKPKPFVKMLVGLPNSIIRRGTTYENRENLTDTFFENIAKYEGTKIGRQEIYGEIIDNEDGGFVKRKDWRLWPAKKKLPKFRFIVLSLDTALTEKSWNVKEQTGDPTACSVWGLFTHENKDNIMLLDCWEDHLGMPELIRRVKHEKLKTYGDSDEPVLRPALISKDRRPSHQGRKADLILIEDITSGKSLRQMLASEGVLTEPYNPGKLDKLSRLHAVSPCFAHGRVWAVESDHLPGSPKTWADPLITQVCTYVGEGSLDHDDLMDTTSQALRYFMDKFTMRFSPQKSVEEAIVAMTKNLNKDRKNPYDGR